MQAETRSSDKLSIGVLYGFRALMVLFVCNFHIWQLGWLGQYPMVFGTRLDLDFWTRSAYVFVDGMMLLSGFLLYLPYARQAVHGTPVPSAKLFYFNRVRRIVPSYLFSVLIALFFFALPGGAYRDAAARNADILTHLTFTFNFFPDTYLYTPLNGVLWTVAVEMQFYLLFPWLARAARKKPAYALAAMAVAGILFRFVMAKSVGDLSLWVNQLPAFLDVYALGMLGAIAYVRLRKGMDTAPKATARIVAAVSVVLFAAGCWALTSLMHLQTDNGMLGHEQLRLSQWEIRLPLAATLLLLMLSAAFLPRLLQKLLDNRLMRFLSTISFNLYVWHQFLSARLVGLFPTTLHNDLQLQQAFTLLCFALSILAAMAATYGIEQPAARGLEKLRLRYQKNKESKKHEGSSGTQAV
ncbi:MAG: acyltransferase [Eubacteriales bacterium]|nr:acyltransferase [Eubacteriales bacterium]